MDVDKAIEDLLTEREDPFMSMDLSSGSRKETWYLSPCEYLPELVPGTPEASDLKAWHEIFDHTIGDRVLGTEYKYGYSTESEVITFEATEEEANALARYLTDLWIFVYVVDW